MPTPSTHRLNGIAALVALLIAVISFSACAATPAATDTLNPSTATQDQLDAEAERVFRLYFEEYVKLEAAGGADQLPPAWSDYVTGEAYESYEGLVRQAKEDGLHWSPGEVTRLVALAPAALDRGAPDAVAVVQACEDTTGNTLLDRSGQVVGHGTLAVRTSSFQWANQSLKIFSAVSEGIDSCPLS